MTKELYEQISKPFKENESLLKLLKLGNKICTLIGFVSYPCLLLLLFMNKDSRLLKCILIPGISFGLFSILRKVLNKKRPYEVLDIKPLIKKDKKGNSFPSRHIFSIFIIGTCWMKVNSIIGFIIYICGCILALIRVIGGVHFPKDVIVGAMIGIVCGILV